MGKIGRVIFELQGVRDTLRNEGERLSYEIARYETLNRYSVSAMKIIADGLNHSNAGLSERLFDHSGGMQSR